MFKILSTGSALPALSKTNDDLSTFLDTSDEWISQRTGIRQRSLCSDETLTDLLTVAAKQALERAGVEPQQLDLILCATIRGEYITPSQACVIQQKLGAGCPAMDISAACTGFVYALDVAASYFARKKVKKVLVLAGDTMSRMVDWNDRSTCVLFGDGAGAVLLGEGDSLQSIHLTAKGDPQVLCIPQPPSNSPFDTLPPQQPFLQMNGKEVYKFAVSAFCSDVTEVCSQAGIQPQQLDWLIPHQANLRIIESALHKLKLPSQRCLTGIQRLGNTSAASIPIVLDEANTKGLLHPGDWIALSAFGAGLTTGACVLRW